MLHVSAKQRKQSSRPVAHRCPRRPPPHRLRPEPRLRCQSRRRQSLLPLAATGPSCTHLQAPAEAARRAARLPAPTRAPCACARRPGRATARRQACAALRSKRCRHTCGAGASCNGAGAATLGVSVTHAPPAGRNASGRPNSASGSSSALRQCVAPSDAHRALGFDAREARTLRALRRPRLRPQAPPPPARGHSSRHKAGLGTSTSRTHAPLQPRRRGPSRAGVAVAAPPQPPRRQQPGPVPRRWQRACAPSAVAARTRRARQARPPLCRGAGAHAGAPFAAPPARSRPAPRPGSPPVQVRERMSCEARRSAHSRLQRRRARDFATTSVTTLPYSACTSAFALGALMAQPRGQLRAARTRLS